jgi:hypothetical protein
MIASISAWKPDRHDVPAVVVELIAGSLEVQPAQRVLRELLGEPRRRA